MNSKKQKMRHSSSSCFGPAAHLPDVGSLYTIRDALAAVEMEKNEHPDNTTRKCVEQVVAAVKAKWIEINPELILIKDHSKQSKRKVSSKRLTNFLTFYTASVQLKNVPKQTVIHRTV